jgi:hypothetical protein
MYRKTLRLPFVAGALAIFVASCSDAPDAPAGDPAGISPSGASYTIVGTPNQQDWRQCQNNQDRDSLCNWVTGNLNATQNTYFEGDFVPKVLRVPGIQDAQPITIVMTYGFLKGGKSTHDFLGLWNEDMTNANPCTSDSFSGKGNNNSPFTGFCSPGQNTALQAITATSNTMDGLSMNAVTAACAARPEMIAYMQNAINAVGADKLVIQGINASSITVTNIVFDGCPQSGDAEAILTMSVTPSAAGVSSQNLLLLFGAHVARSFDWQNGGAGGVSGSPYHLGLVSLDGTTAGSMDLQMAANAIVVPATISVEKQCVGGSANFLYTGTEPSGGALPGFDLDCGESMQVVETTDFGAYTITESALAGWALTGLSCVGGSTSVNVGTRTASITLAEGDAVHCTFTNTKQAMLRVAKTTVPAGDATAFTFTPTGWNGGATFTRADGEAAFASAALAPGSYSVDETVPAGWALTSRACVLTGTATPANFTNSGASGVSVTLGAGQDVTCTFTNTKQAMLRVAKTTVPAGDATAFTFTPTGWNGGATFTRADGEAAFASAALAPGSYSVDETVPAGWALTSRACVLTGTATPATFANSGASGVSVTLGAGQDVTCTFTNTKQAILRVAKTTVPAGDATAFTFTPTGWNGGATFTRADGETAFASAALAPGAYSVDETVPAGWALTSRACVLTGTATPANFANSGASGVSVTLGAGQDVTCTFTNTKQPQVRVKKLFDPVDDGGLVSFTIDGGAYDNAGAGFGHNGQTAWITVDVGDNVAFSEAGYGATSLADYTSSWSCDNGASGSGTSGLTGALSAGDQVTCTFTNVRNAPDSETAWAANGLTPGSLRFNPGQSGNWATYLTYSGAEKTVNFYAGQTTLVGQVNFSAAVGGMVTVTVTLSGGWTFDPDASLAIQGYSSQPRGNPSPGQFEWQFDANDSPYTTVPIAQANYLAVHGVVIPPPGE